MFDELLPFLEACLPEGDADPDSHVLTKYRRPSGACIRKRIPELIEKAGLERWLRSHTTSDRVGRISWGVRVQLTSRVRSWGTPQVSPTGTTFTRRWMI